MKNASLILSIIAIVAVAVLGILSMSGNRKPATASKSAASDSTAVTAVKGDIVYLEFERILQGYDMANDNGAVLETKAQNIQSEIDRRSKKFETEYNAYMEKVNKGLITRSVAEIQGQKLQQQQQELNTFVNQKNNEMAEEQAVFMNQIVDALKTYLEKYNKEKQYSMILINQNGSPVFMAQPGLDITDEVLAGMNEEYVNNKKNN